MLRFCLMASCAMLLTLSAAHAGDDKKGMGHGVDTNGDGMVTSAEAETAVNRQFANLDTDKSSKISKEEFKGTWGMAAKHIPAEVLKKNKGMIEKAGAMRFEKMDADKSGDLTKAELLTDMKARHKAMDGNGDGNVTKEELKSFHEKMRAEHAKRSGK